jgi:hypothetical protein
MTRNDTYIPVKYKHQDTYSNITKAFRCIELILSERSETKGPFQQYHGYENAYTSIHVTQLLGNLSI